MITYTYDEQTKMYNLTYENGMYMGSLYQEIDGYYVWNPTWRGGGYIPSHVLLSIGNYLEHINKEWDEKVMNDC
jgi:hypothetical protein